MAVEEEEMNKKNKEHYWSATFTHAQIGEHVWSLVHGAGKIKNVSPTWTNLHKQKIPQKYPITVGFHEKDEDFSWDGVCAFHSPRILFWHKPPREITETKWEDMIGRKVKFEYNHKKNVFRKEGIVVGINNNKVFIEHPFSNYRNPHFINDYKLQNIELLEIIDIAPRVNWKSLIGKKVKILCSYWEEPIEDTVLITECSNTTLYFKCTNGTQEWQWLSCVHLVE